MLGAGASGVYSTENIFARPVELEQDSSAIEVLEQGDNVICVNEFVQRDVDVAQGSLQSTHIDDEPDDWQPAIVQTWPLHE